MDSVWAEQTHPFPLPNQGRCQETLPAQKDMAGSSQGLNQDTKSGFLLHILLKHALQHLPSSGSAWWVLGICVMVKRVSDMSERKVSKSKCCLLPRSSSSSPSSMGTTLQKSWLHHFSVGLQTSSSYMR